MSSQTSSRRKKQRSRSSDTHILRIGSQDSQGHARYITADLFDYNAQGVGVSLAIPLAVGMRVSVTGRLQDGGSPHQETCQARVAWCLEKSDGSFRAGLQFDRPEKEQKDWRPAAPAQEPEEEDYYEILQLSPNAHPDTIHRVFKLLAQRFHPDNRATGDEETFKRILASYRVLSDPEARAAYDARRDNRLRSRWRIFDQPSVANGVEAEKRKRKGILGVLYAQRLNDADHPALSIQELEDMLGCPRDHLELSLWYLKEKGLIERNDRGRYSVTVHGVDQAESDGPPDPANRLLLGAGDP